VGKEARCWLAAVPKNAISFVGPSSLGLGSLLETAPLLMHTTLTTDLRCDAARLAAYDVSIVCEVLFSNC